MKDSLEANFTKVVMEKKFEAPSIFTHCHLKVYYDFFYSFSLNWLRLTLKLGIVESERQHG